MVPPSGVTNSKRNLPNPVVTWSDVPSLPCTLSDFITALGKVSMPVDVGDTVISNIILPKVLVEGKLRNVKVVSAVIVSVW